MGCTASTDPSQAEGCEEWYDEAHGEWIEALMSRLEAAEHLHLVNELVDLKCANQTTAIHCSTCPLLQTVNQILEDLDVRVVRQLGHGFSSCVYELQRGDQRCTHRTAATLLVQQSLCYVSTLATTLLYQQPLCLISTSATTLPLSPHQQPLCYIISVYLWVCGFGSFALKVGYKDGDPCKERWGMNVGELCGKPDYFTNIYGMRKWNTELIRGCVVMELVGNASSLQVNHSIRVKLAPNLLCSAGWVTVGVFSWVGNSGCTQCC